jgi:DNA-binding MarR family transcriptional regulator
MVANPTFEPPEQIYLFVQHLGRRLRDIDAAAGITPARFSALASLAFHGPINLSQLAADERVSRPAMTRLARDMEEAGLVVRSPDPDDGRGVRIAPTPKGLALVHEVRNRKIALVADYLAGLDPPLQRQVAAVFTALEELAEPTQESP